MANPVTYGAQIYQTPSNPSNIRYDVIGKTSEVIAVGDLLTMSSGVLKVVAAATDAVAGVAAQKITAAQNDATKYVPYIPADENYVFFMGTNSDLTDNATNYGTFYSVTGSTGAQLVDTNGGVKTTTSRQVMIVKVDPRGVGGSGSGSGLREVLVKFVRIPEFNGAFN
jgi:hypothetical protein